MHAYHERVQGDLFDISSRLKEIDQEYELLFNRKLQRWEIFARGALQIAVPFKRLDGRTLELARETRMERINQILAQIERENALISQIEQQKAMDRLHEALEG